METMMMNETLTPEEEKLNEVALGYVERLVNAWMGKGLPLPVLARTMIGMGTSCIEGSQGHALAVDAIDTIREQLEDNRPKPRLVS